ncbi:F0F1 ATP synthase subunit B [Pseudarthrobacter sp. J75]|uniref:F0F1 ATP synthase subunit B n=1 Tax=unclassified Pseudarthrobacter TaxID=2647000 RepID=UPI002E8228E9|nr:MULTISPECIES: F0F1 ATP synthase subunit B [unclassified Pseudarthrobacter]MEE2521469.1 F0F1 ATP synthase subunit B [Pseudarthrobacter sp. J47]MEE2528701.1 F0F1 ATP synthase subunit B [Pseudarthrobacter sp. J75]MEE2568393.1 F0F1 ATP synthase subunit B [Pseudarthrobacter sp. J64]
MNQLIISAATEGEVSPLVPNVWEMGVVLISFAVLMFIVVKFVVPMFEKTFAERAEAIEGGIAKAEKAQAEASAALEEYKQQLTDARTEANRIREEARAEGAQILADLKEKAGAESARITAQAYAQIEAERQAAVVSLRSEVGTLATTLAGRIVGEALTDDERAARVVDRFLADLESQNAGAAK